jgi:hypothetical protein
MILERYEKQPAELKDYDISYTEWLAPVSDTLLNASTAVSCLTNPEDTALVCNATFVSPQSVKVWMAGGTDGERYKATVTVTTAGGRIDQSELVFSVKDR